MINPRLPLGINELQRRQSELMSACVSIEQLKKDTGFVSRISFEEGMKRTISYYQKIIVEGRNI